MKTEWITRAELTRTMGYSYAKLTAIIRTHPGFPAPEKRIVMGTMRSVYPKNETIEFIKSLGRKTDSAIDNNLARAFITRRA